MTRDRPVPITVLASASLLLGGLAVCVGGACAVATTLEASLFGFDSVPRHLHPSAYFRDRVFGYAAYETMRPATTVLLGLGLLVAGWGLWRRRRWAPKVAALLAVAALVSTVGALFYEIGFVLPALEAWQNTGRDTNHRPRLDASGVWLAPAMQMTLGLLLVVLAFATLVMLLSPAVTDAFAETKDEVGATRASC